jgi:hypothetical protein
MLGGRELELSGRVMAVRLKRLVSKRDLAMKPPLRPPAFDGLLVLVRSLGAHMITYADHGDVLDVVACRHIPRGIFNESGCYRDLG